jgi:hypothetical protein
LLARIILLLLNALFVEGYHGLRRGSLALPLALAVLYGSGLVASFSVLAGLIAAYAVSGSLRLVAYASLVASIPSTWMALTQLTLDLMVGRELQPSLYGSIFLRSMAYSLLALSILHSVNPLEVGYVVYKLTGSCAAAYAVPFTLKTIGQLLRDAGEAVLAHRLRGVRPWTTLALLLIRADEASRAIEESIALRLHVCRPKVYYDVKAVLAQAVGVCIAVLFSTFQVTPLTP